MEIYVLRHGEAEERETGLADRDRKLTAKGKRDLKDLLKLARKAEVSPSCRFFSKSNSALRPIITLAITQINLATNIQLPILLAKYIIQFGQIYVFFYTFGQIEYNQHYK